MAAGAINATALACRADQFDAAVDVLAEALPLAVLLHRLERERDLRVRLACERLTGVSQAEPLTGPDIQRGIDREPLAREWAATTLGVDIDTRVGFVTRDEVEAGASPDGLIAADAFLEVKCPRAARHLAWMDAAEIPTDHTAQLLHLAQGQRLELVVAQAPELVVVAREEHQVLPR